MNPEEYPEEFWRWIDEHIYDNPSKLRLTWHGRMPWLEAAVTQIECRRKTSAKLADELAFDRFYFPSAIAAEQSTSDVLARMHASLVKPGSRAIDLTCGLGVDAIHMARHGCTVTAVDMDQAKSVALGYNAACIGLDGNITAVCGDCRDVVGTLRADSFDVAFIDPARRDAAGGRVYSLADCSPDVAAMADDVLRVAPRLIVKASPMLDISHTIRLLQRVDAVYATGTSAECREIVVVMSRGADRDPDSVPVTAWTPTTEFSFTPAEEAAAPEADYGVPQAGMYLYEPSAVAMKAAPWRLLAARFGLTAMAPNTHLYFCREAQDGFPGSCRRIGEVLPLSSGVMKRFARQYPEAEIAVRNAGKWTAETLRAKLRIAQPHGNDAVRIICGAAASGQLYLIVLQTAS